MTLDEFEAGLAEIIKPSFRPFVCEGSPLGCDVFIVGCNPATQMEGDWWDFWKSGYGHQKSLWKQEYLKQRDGKTSKTRNRIEAIVGGLDNVRVLEGNIDARPSKKMTEYPKPHTKAFDYLLETCRPKVVIAHGVKAEAHLQEWAKDGKLISSKHFVRVGHKRTAEIIAEAWDALAVGVRVPTV